MPEKKINKKELEIAYSMKTSPIFTIGILWGLSPQPILEEYKELVDNLIIEGKYNEIKKEYFGEFIRGRHFTWQQFLILRAIELGLEGKASKKISIRSGHGIGKSTTMAWSIIWFLICYPDCRIPCTAPTGDQLHDVLWTEIRTWIGRFPEVKWLQNKLEVQKDKVYINETGNSAFARARTARKEAPEALAGLHAENMMMVVDEASGVPDEIYNVAKGAFTEKNVIVLLISNPTRLDGYFYRTHHDYQDKWQRLNFSTLDSPLSTSDDYAKEIAEEHGIRSDEYKIRVLGDFPEGSSVDEKGWSRLLELSEIKKAQEEQDDDLPFIGNLRMGIDPAGEGTDISSWVVRDKFKARIVSQEKISNKKSIAERTLTLFVKYPGIEARKTYIDNFGVGAEITKEIALAGINTTGINVGDKAKNSELYANIKAEAYMRLRRWIQSGGKLSHHKDWEELTHVRFRRGLNGKVQIMSKREMRTAGYKSPNNADALMMTFIDEESDDLMNRIKNKVKQFKPNYKKVSYHRSV